MLRQPSDTTLMSFQAALDVVDSGPDYSLDPSTEVWVVHVYGTYANPLTLPPELIDPTTTGDSAGPTTTTVARSFFVVLDASSGRVVIKAY